MFCYNIFKVAMDPRRGVRGGVLYLFKLGGVSWQNSVKTEKKKKKDDVESTQRDVGCRF